MLESKFIIGLLFKIINFTLLAWLIKYVFQKHLLPGFKEKINKKTLELKALEEKKANLAYQSDLLEQEILKQDELFNNLKNKIELWNKQTMQQQEESSKQFTEISKEHEKRMEIQMQNLNTQKLLNEIFPRVISGTYRQMEQKFSQEQETQKFFRNIIGFMEKESQK